MNRKQMNLAEMLLMLEEFLTTNLTSFENKPAIISVIDELKTKNAEIINLSLSQAVSTEADFTIKDADEEALIATAVKVSDRLKEIAATTHDAHLKIEGSVSQWELSHMRKDNMYVRLKQLRATALPFVDQLLPLGVSQAEVDSLNTESTKLSKVKPEINIIQAKNSKATNDLDKTIKDINTLVRETLDNLMLEFKLLNPGLYGEYLLASKVYDRRGGFGSKNAAQDETAK